MVWEELGRDRGAGARRRAGARARSLHRPPALRPADQPARTARRRAGSYCARGSARRPRAQRRADGSASCASCSPTVQEPHLRELLERVLGEDSRAVGTPTATAPAAKHYHQAYRHGLLEHCLGVAQAVSAISATFPGIDRDVAVTGALLHDIGKLEAYTEDPRRDRLDRRRAAAGRDRARLLPRPPRDRGDRGLPGASSRRR